MDTPLAPSLLPRVAAGAMELALRTAPVVLLPGGRQTGKATLVPALPVLANRPCLALDEVDLRVTADAGLLLHPGQDPVPVTRRGRSQVVGLHRGPGAAGGPSRDRREPKSNGSPGTPKPPS